MRYPVVASIRGTKDVEQVRIRSGGEADGLLQLVGLSTGGRPITLVTDDTERKTGGDAEARS